VRKSHCISNRINKICEKESLHIKDSKYNFSTNFFFCVLFYINVHHTEKLQKKIYQSSTTHIPFHYYVKFKKCRIYYNVCLLLNSNLKYGWVGDSCLNVKQAVTMARTCYMIKWDDDDIFVLDQHAELGFYSASSLKQQFVGRLSLYS
jgi:hypothetical protein